MVLDLRLRRPPLVDVAIAAAFVLLAVTEAVVDPAISSPARHVLVSGGALGLLAFRRQFPLGVGVLVVAAHLVTNPHGEFSVLLSLVVIFFTLGAELPPPRSYVGLGLLGTAFLVATSLDGFVPSDLAAALVFLGGPFSVGTASRQRTARSEEAVERAARLEREQAVAAAAAVQEERSRIARELHDIVSHSLSVIAIQTQAVRRRLGADHAREVADLAAIETTSRQALAEMRRLFGMLRADGEAAALAPQPGLAELGRLVEQVRSAGLDVELQERGERQDLPPGVDLAAFRVLQEALTNVLRHAQAQRVTVTVSHTPNALELDVEDDGRGLGDQSGGHGLVGVRERVALYGGTCRVVDGAGRGVRLSAVLPLRESR